MGFNLMKKKFIYEYKKAINNAKDRR